MRPAISLTAAFLIPALGGAGCEGLDLSAKGEGTGIQVIGAVVVLAKYRASQRQKTIAEEQARRAFVELALEPAYEARAKELKRQAASGRAPARPRAGASAAAAPDPQAEARAELAALMASWKETATSYTNGRYAGDFATPGVDAPAQAEVSFPRLSESQVLAASAAYVPRYLAVAVPAEQTVAGARTSIMLWDTRAHRLASDTVYALDRTPSATKPTEIDSLKVLFAGQ